MSLVRHTGGPFWREDHALDAALAALAPPSAPRTGAAQILAFGAATPIAPLPPIKPSVTSTAGSVQGIALWKVAAVAMVGATLGLAALRALDDGPAASTGAPALSAMGSPTADSARPDPRPPVPVGNETPPIPSAPVFVATPATAPANDPGPRDAVATVAYTGLVPAPVRAQTPAATPEPREELLTLRVALPANDGETRLRLAAGLLAAPRSSRAAVASMGPELQLSVARLGAAEGLARPMLVAELDLGTQIPAGLRTAHFCGGLLAGAGFAIDGSRIRLELAWTGGARVAPDRVAPDASFAIADGTRQRPQLHPTMGPQLGVAIHPDQGPDLRFGATLQGSLEHDDALAAPRLQPWVGLSAGIDLPVPRSAG